MNKKTVISTKFVYDIENRSIQTHNRAHGDTEHSSFEVFKGNIGQKT